MARVNLVEFSLYNTQHEATSMDMPGHSRCSSQAQLQHKGGTCRDVQLCSCPAPHPVAPAPHAEGRPAKSEQNPGTQC